MRLANGIFFLRGKYFSKVNLDFEKGNCSNQVSGNWNEWNEQAARIKCKDSLGSPVFFQGNVSIVEKLESERSKRDRWLFCTRQQLSFFFQNRQSKNKWMGVATNNSNGIQLACDSLLDCSRLPFWRNRHVLFYFCLNALHDSYFSYFVLNKKFQAI